MLTPIKLFFRAIKRNKLFSFINILGLTVGFLCTTLIYLYVRNETSYDKFHELGDRIYRVNQTFIWGEDDSFLFSSTGPGVSFAISSDVPEVEQVVRIHTPEAGEGPVRIKAGDQEKLFHNEIVRAADSNFLKVFSYPLKYGDRQTALMNPNSVILSKEASVRFFGEEDPMGKLIDIGGGPLRESYKVTGVVDDVPGNTYIEFDMMISLNSIDRIGRSNWSWMWTTFETFIVLNDKADPEDVRKKVGLLPPKYATETLDVMGYASYQEYIESGKEWNLYLQPFHDIHLYSINIHNRLNTTGNYRVVAALISSAIFIIILSCINFINLSTSQFTSKAKNVALRKVLGSGAGALRRIYISEAFMYCLLSAALSMGLLVYALPFFNDMVGLQLTALSDPILPLFLIGIVIVVGLLAGLYPAIFFSGFKPVAAMKGEFKTGKLGVKIKNGMMVIQYALSLLLIISSGVVYEQLKFIYNSDLGFKRDQLITIDNVHWMNSSEGFGEELKKVEGVRAASLCDATPLLVYNGDSFMPDKEGAGSVALNYTLGDESYIPMLDLEVIVGRGFNKSYSDDINGIVLNESAANSIGWTIDESILNRKISNWTGEYHVIGVVRDFNYWAMSVISPFAIFHSSSNAQGNRPIMRVAVSLSATSGDEMRATLNRLEEKWNEFLPNRPFEYTIIDQVYKAQFESEERFGNILTLFTSLTLLIAGLGLLGMVIFSIEQKTKEIGIRKVLGASMMGIATLFTIGYIRLLVVAFLIAAPLGYYFMNQWLLDYEFRIDISPAIFIVALAALFIISVLISSYHSIKASMLNPADILKDE